MDDRKIDFALISSERAPRNVGKTERERAKKGAAGKPSGRRRQVGKKGNFEPDSEFRREKGKGKRKGTDGAQPKVKKEKAPSAKTPSAKTQKIAAATKAKRAAKKKTAE